MNNGHKVLARLVELQQDSAPVELTIGSVNDTNQVTRTEVILRKAPPKVVHAIVGEFEFVSLDDRGLRISVRWDQ